MNVHSNGNAKSSAPASLRKIRCAVYTRKSSEEGLDMEFNSLDAQREACEAYVASQRHEGWVLHPDRYDDGGYSGGTIERPALKRLLADIQTGNLDCVVVYKLDRFSRSLLDFTKIIEILEAHQVTFISITQQFNTTTSMGRLTLNMLLSFAQFEREIIGERIRDKYASSKRKGKYMGGMPVLGYDVDREKKRLVVNESEAALVREIFRRFVASGSTTTLMKELNAEGQRTKSWTTKKGQRKGGERWNKSHIYRCLNNVLYIGRVSHKTETFPGEHKGIVDQAVWDKVQAILESNHRARGNETRRETEALLKGLIECGCCHCAMGPTFTRRKGRTYRYYLCVQASKRGYKSCGLRTVAAGVIEEAVVNQLRALFKTPEVIAETWLRTETTSRELLERYQREQATLQRECEALREEAHSLVQAVGRKAASTALQESLRDLDARLAAKEERLRKVTSDLTALQGVTVTETDAAKALTTLDPIWENLVPVEQARIVELLVEKVTVTPEGMDLRLRPHGIRSLVAELKPS